MKRKYLKLSALILAVSSLTVLSSCETSARYIGSNEWEGRIVQEGNVSFTLQFRLWQGWYSEEQSPLSYGDLYVWSDMNNWTSWMQCYVDNDGRYALDVESIEVGTYEYSLVIWYNDEEIPDPEEDNSIWDYKVNIPDDSATNNVFTVTTEILEENESLGYIPIDVSNSYTLGDLLTFRLKDYTFNFMFTSDGSTVTTCPDYGSLYINGNFTQSTGSWVSDYYQLTLNTDNVTYSVTIPRLWPGEMEFNILFVYSGDDPANAWGTQQLFESNQTLTIDSSSGNNYNRTVETYNLGFDFSEKFAQLGATLESYTLSFYIYKTSGNTAYNQGSSLSNGWNVYILGTYPGSNWDYADLCAYTNTDGNITFEVTLSELVQGQSYSYNLLLAGYYSADRHVFNWTDYDNKITQSSFIVPSDAVSGGSMTIEVESDIWFDQYGNS